VIRDLLKGSYVINANADGYLGVRAVRRGPARPPPIDVGDGERYERAHPPWKNAVVTGTVVDNG
jgi:hypothetical protein